MKEKNKILEREMENNDEWKENGTGNMMENTEFRLLL